MWLLREAMAHKILKYVDLNDDFYFAWRLYDLSFSRVVWRLTGMILGEYQHLSRLNV